MRAARNANVRMLGTKQNDAIRNITGYGFYIVGNRYFYEPNFHGAFAESAEKSQYTIPHTDTPGGEYKYPRFVEFNASRVVPVGGDNRPLNIAAIPRQKR